LSVAKTYIELHPAAKVVLLDDADTVGGTWAKHRLYPGLVSNNLLGTFEYSDFPMDETYGVQLGQPIPGTVVQKYLENYAKRFGVLGLIRFKSKVETAERKEGDGWILTVSSGGQQKQIHTSKLVVATGLTSEPFMPAFAGSDKFDGLIFHSKDFRRQANSLETAKSVVVYGGHKSAWDAAYEYAVAGAQVHMVIRESGHGPVWMCPPYVTPLKQRLEQLVHTRLLTWLSPCIWGDADGYSGIRRFLHGTAFGRGIVNAFWAILGNDVVTLNGFEKHPETKKLKPWTNPMFVAASLGILNYRTNFFDLVREGKIKVHIADIDSLSGNNVRLSSGDVLTADAIICATGWRHHPPIKFLPDGIDGQLGLPHFSKQTDKLAQKADEEILDRFPRLKDQPVPNPKARPLEARSSMYPAAIQPNQPYRLYRFMVPPALINDRSIGFAGAVMAVCTSLIVQTQALWLSAYFDGKIRPVEDIAYETVLYSQFGKWRYPAGHGARFPDFAFDGIPYIDLLLTELGLRTHRKKGWLAEFFSPYGPQDYQGLVEEWRDQNKNIRG
jgi:cation diffusion facilitator CzcD-associated flavoprotein CzcO